MGNANDTEAEMMKCTVQGCPGELEHRKVVHTVRHEGKVVVIDGVPVEVCAICSDVLLKPETVRRIEAILRSVKSPDRTAPVYEYA